MSRSVIRAACSQQDTVKLPPPSFAEVAFTTNGVADRTISIAYFPTTAIPRTMLGGIVQGANSSRIA